MSLTVVSPFRYNFIVRVRFYWGGGFKAGRESERGWGLLVGWLVGERSLIFGLFAIVVCVTNYVSIKSNFAINAGIPTVNMFARI